MHASTTLIRSALAVAVSALALPALAQPSLDEVIVTAQKREQSLQDVPIAVSALSADALRASVVTDIYDLRVAVPALEIRAVDPPSQGTAFAIRGLGTSVFNMGFEPTVATFVDGVYRSRSGLLASSDLIDMERIEVLKGPQGTLFGKNTTGGVVAMYTKKPDVNETSGSVEFSYEEYNRMRANGVLNLPLVEGKAALRLSGSWADGDGWLDNVNSGNEIHDLDRYNLRGQLLFLPNEDLSIRVIADYAELDEACCTPVPYVNDRRAGAVNGPIAGAAGNAYIDPADPYEYEAAINTDPQLSAEDRGLSAEINWDLGDVALTSISAWRDYEDQNYKDNDFGGVDVLYSNQDLPEVSLLSQELRLAGDCECIASGLEWTVGAYYAKERIELNNEFIWGTQGLNPPFAWHLPMGRAYLAAFEQDTETLAAFVHGILHINQRLALTLGARYTDDQKEGELVNDQPLVPVPFPPFQIPAVFPLGFVYDYDAEKDDSEPTYTASLQYDFADNVMGYVSYTHGYKSGGISMTRDAGGTLFAFSPGGPVGPNPPQDPTFDKETADSFELGLKSELLDDRLRLLAAAWYTEFTDLQVQVLRPADGAFAVATAEGATSQGVELEGTLAVTEGLRLNASVQWVDATYDDGTGALSGVADLDGEELGFVSDWTGTMGAAYETAINDSLALFLDGNVFWRTDQQLRTEIQRYDTEEPGYALLTLRAGVKASDESWELAAWCRNCTDESYAVSRFQIPFDGYIFPPHNTTWAHLGMPRVMGVTGTYRF
jgi:outer membrane receptor protein involved in Fe transport